MARSSCYQGYNQNQIQDKVNNANSAFILINRLISQGFQSVLIGPGGPGDRDGPDGPGGPGGPGVQCDIGGQICRAESSSGVVWVV